MNLIVCVDKDFNVINNDFAFEVFSDTIEKLLENGFVVLGKEEENREVKNCKNLYFDKSFKGPKSNILKYIEEDFSKNEVVSNYRELFIKLRGQRDDGVFLIGKEFLYALSYIENIYLFMELDAKEIDYVTNDYGEIENISELNTIPYFTKKEGEIKIKDNSIGSLITYKNEEVEMYEIN